MLRFIVKNVNKILSLFNCDFIKSNHPRLAQTPGGHIAKNIVVLLIPKEIT